MPDWIYSDTVDRKPDPANQQAKRMFREVMAVNPPGQWTADRYQQTQTFVGVIYTAIRARMTAMASSTVQVMRYRKKQEEVATKALLKALTSPHGSQNDERWTPVEPIYDYDVDEDAADDLVKLIERPNPSESISQILAQIEMQINLTGSANIWVVRSRGGWPCQIYVIPTALILAQPPSPEFPQGYWRVQQNYPGYYAMGGFVGWGVNIDVREMLTIRSPHPLWRWDGYSPLTACGIQLDVLNSIDQARWAFFQHGSRLGVVFMLPGIGDTQIDALQAKMSATHEGAANFGRNLVVGGEQNNQGGNPGWDVKIPQPNASVMDFQEGWEQMATFCEAVFGVAGVSGLKDADSYAAFFARLKQFHTLTLQPQAKFIGESLTRGIATKFGRGLRIQIDVPKIDDTENQRAMLALQPGPLYTFNEARGSLNLPPVEGGDVPAEIYLAKLQQKMQPQVAAPGGEEREETVVGPHGVTEKVTEEVNSGEKPLAPTPSKPPIPQPQNMNGKGSLPNRIKGLMTPLVAPVGRAKKKSKKRRMDRMCKAILEEITAESV